MREKCEDEGSSGDVDENKEEQVYGVRFQVGALATGRGASELRELTRNNAKMKVHPGMLMKTQKSGFQAPGFRWERWRVDVGLPNPGIDEEKV